MGATLKRRGGCFRWKRDGWSDLLTLAKRHGWKARGTLPPRGMRKGDWDQTDNLSGARQQVTGEDAQELGEALSRAVASEAKKSRLSKSGLLASLYIDAVAEFIDFCRRGAFRITDDVCDG